MTSQNQASTETLKRVLARIHETILQRIEPHSATGSEQTNWIVVLAGDEQGPSGVDSL